MTFSFYVLDDCDTVIHLPFTSLLCRNNKEYLYTLLYHCVDVSFFSGNALLRRLVRIGVLDEGKMKLDYVLGLKLEDFLERRLQTQVFKLGLAKSIHHARVLIRQRHIRLILKAFSISFEMAERIKYYSCSRSAEIMNSNSCRYCHFLMLNSFKHAPYPDEIDLVLQLKRVTFLSMR